MSTQNSKKILQNIKDLLKNKIQGIQISIPNNFDNINEITAIIQGPESTPFERGAFKIRLKLTEDFPKVPPKAFFLTKVFHPNVEPKSGEVCVNTLKSEWTPNLGLQKVLLTIRCLLINPNAESALNEEAGKLILEDYNEFFQRAKLMTEVYAMSNVTQSTRTSRTSTKQEMTTTNHKSKSSNSQIEKGGETNVHGKIKNQDQEIESINPDNSFDNLKENIPQYANNSNNGNSNSNAAVASGSTLKVTAKKSKSAKSKSAKSKNFKRL